MQINGRHLLRDFSRRHASARMPLRRWVTVVEGSNWKAPAEIRKTYADVSFVKTTTVFNIGGNKFRLLTHVLYPNELVVVYNILTHSEYDKLRIE